MIRWKRIVDMAVAYIRRPADAATFELVFRYQNQNVGIDRVFNFQRSVSESIASTINRIKTNVEKEHNKKLKKMKKNMKKSKADSTTTGSASASDNSDQINVDFAIEKSESTTWSEIFANADDHEFKTIKLKIVGQEFSVAYNLPYVNQVDLPSVIIVGYDCYPSKFEVVFTDRDKCTFEWYRGSNVDSDVAWSKCEQEGFFYNVQPSDLRHKLKVFKQNDFHSFEMITLHINLTVTHSLIHSLSVCMHAKIGDERRSKD